MHERSFGERIFGFFLAVAGFSTLPSQARELVTIIGDSRQEVAGHGRNINVERREEAGDDCWNLGSTLWVRGMPNRNGEKLSGR